MPRKKQKKISKTKPYFFEDPKKRIRLLQGLTAQMTFSQAARYAGINPRTLRKFKNTIPEEDVPPEVIKFWEQLQQSIAEAEYQALITVQEGEKGWIRKAWYLDKVHGYSKIDHRDQRLPKKQEKPKANQPMKRFMDECRFEPELSITPEIVRKYMEERLDELAQTIKMEGHRKNSRFKRSCSVLQAPRAEW